MTEEQKKLEQARHRLEEAQMRNRRRDRNARTRNLIQKGAVLESIFPQTKEMSPEETEDFLICLAVK